jgi:hypothetical protein
MSEATKIALTMLTPTIHHLRVPPRVESLLRQQTLIGNIQAEAMRGPVLSVA